jgi:hypothetical protein
MNKEKQEDNDEPLDVEKIAGFTTVLIKDFIKVITSKPSSKEMSCAALSASAHVLVILAQRIVGPDRAVDIISTAISHAFEGLSGIRKEMKIEQDTNTRKTGG